MWKPKKVPRNSPKALPRGHPALQQGHDVNSKQLYKGLHWLLWISVLANTAPIAVLPGREGRVYRHLHICWMIVCYGWFCQASYWELVLNTLKKVSLDCYLNAVESAIYVVHIGSILVLTFQWRHRIPAVLDGIVKSDLERGYTIKCQQIKRFLRLQLSLVLVLACSAFVIDICSQRFVVLKAVLSINSYVMPNIISSLSFIQYYVLLQGIAWRQAAVTGSLQRELQQFPRRWEVHKLRLQHTELTRFTKLVNTAYQYSIVLLVIGCFFNFNLNLFLVYKGIDVPEMTDSIRWLYQVLWLAMHMGKVHSILYFNHKVQQEQSNCLALLNRVQCVDPDLLETLNHFILQLQTNVRQHVVCGVIVLDLKYLSALLVACANFFIFLLQYDVTYEALSRQGNSSKT
ncbi:putative gustatory receptor 59f [Drosophila guanche]|uniref:Gustatory receptor n=1 Tax=Drosophila guanche TaxID=7266 RepID=A0A3B0J113_DROGU|nr:putative gustatory receptor 59f [Drosophila guanche]SPP74467.1 blast:Putative gustatory receptor 59f [Drosophila guanche]